MDTIAVITATFGGYDVPQPQAAQDLDVKDWICFTDDPSLAAPEPWRVELEDGAGAHPNLAAKRFKLLPPVPHKYAVWIDANMEITSPTFVADVLACMHDGIAVYLHPRRRCIYDEAEASLGSEGQNGRYAHLPIREQVAHYRAGGHPVNGGLYGCGTIAWDLTDQRAQALGRAWMDECERWGYQDQLSFPVVCRRLGIVPGTFPFKQIERRYCTPNFIANRCQRIHPHTVRH